MIKDDINIIKLFFKSIPINRKNLILIFSCLIICGIISLVIPVCISEVINSLTRLDSQNSYKFIAIAFGLEFLYFIFSFINKKIYIRNYNYYFKRIQNIILNSILKYNENEINKLSKGKLNNIISNDVGNLSMLTEQICELIIGLVKMMIIFIICLKFNIIMGILMIVFDIIHIKILDYYNKNITNCENLIYKSKDKINDLFGEIVDGNKEIKSYHLTKKMNSILNSRLIEHENNFFLKWKYLIMNFTFFPFLLEVFKYLLYFYLGYNVLNSKISIGTLVLIISYYESVLSYSETFLFNTKELRMKKISIDRFNDVALYKKNYSKFGNLNKLSEKFMIEFKDIDFKYEDKYIFKNFNLKINCNEITSIVGKNGSGKSTLIKLLLRINDVSNGEILLNNHNINDYSEEFYNTNISVVYQKSFLFNMSIKDNLLLINNDFDKILDICKEIGVHEKILKLENGYDTILNKDGNNISGGEKQLICLARALLLDPKVLILDEINNSLDLNVQNELLELLVKLKKKCTIILISHNNQFINISDNIIKIN